MALAKKGKALGVEWEAYRREVSRRTRRGSRERLRVQVSADEWLGSPRVWRKAMHRLFSLGVLRPRRAAGSLRRSLVDEKLPLRAPTPQRPEPERLPSLFGPTPNPRDCRCR